MVTWVGNAASCSQYLLNQMLSTCATNCCGTSTCQCVSSPSSFATISTMDRACSFSSCVRGAYRLSECTDVVEYAVANENFTSCEGERVARKCSTYAQQQGTESCIESLSCAAVAPCTVDCYTMVLLCHEQNLCAVSAAGPRAYCLEAPPLLRGGIGARCLTNSTCNSSAAANSSCYAEHKLRCESAALSFADAFNRNLWKPSMSCDSLVSKNSLLETAVIVVSAVVILCVLTLAALLIFVCMMIQERNKMLRVCANAYRDAHPAHAVEEPHPPTHAVGQNIRTAFGTPRAAQLQPSSSLPIQGGPSQLDPVEIARDTGNDYAATDDYRVKNIVMHIRNKIYQRGALLGKGSSASVYSCILGDGSFVALKAMDARELAMHDAVELSNELRMMSKLRNRHIIRYYHAEHCEQSREVLLFMEFVHGGSLGKLVRSLPNALDERIVRTYIRQVVNGLCYLHSQKIVHRDIKADNLLIDSSEGIIKVGDFGSAKTLRNRKSLESLVTATTNATDTIVGTPLWMAPEVINPDNRFATGYDYKADIWSLGITLCELLDQGRTPWPDFQSTWAALYHIGNCTEPPRFQGSSKPSCECLDFLNVCLQTDPMVRPSAAKLLSHTWLAVADETDWAKSNESVSFMYREAVEQLAQLHPAPERKASK